MGSSNTYSRKQISRILSRASEIQASRNNNETSPDGLTEAELQHVADEVGISRDVLEEALLTYDVHTEEEGFNWLNATNKIQQTSRLPGTVDEEKWEEIVQEIRRITGGIGKVSKVGNSFEWEQRRKEIGYTHISLTPGQHNTKLQYVANWRGMKMMANVFSFMATFTITAIALDGTNFGDIPALLFAVGGGLLGLPVGQFFLKSYYEKQKQQVKNLISSITRIVNKPAESQISIEDEELYTVEKEPPASSSLKTKLQ